MLDSAILRPGRFDRIILASVPDKKSREAIFKVHTKNMPLAKEVDIKQFSEKTEGYTGADIESLCRETAMLALRANLDATQVTKDNFEQAMLKVRPSVTKRDIEVYKKIEEKYLRSARAAIEQTIGYLG